MKYVGSSTASMEPDCVGILDDQRIRAVSFPNCRDFDEKQFKTDAKAANDHFEALSEWCTASTATKNITVVLSLGMQRLSRDEPYALSKDFFRRESVERMHVVQPASDIIRGHIGQGKVAPATTLGEFTRPSLKETFSIVPETPPDAGTYYAAPGSDNHFAPDLWPEEPEGLRDAFPGYWDELGTISAEMMRLNACARARRGAFRRQHRPACLGLQRDVLTRPGGAAGNGPAGRLRPC